MLRSLVETKLNGSNAKLFLAVTAAALLGKVEKVDCDLNSNPEVYSRVHTEKFRNSFAALFAALFRKRVSPTCRPTTDVARTRAILTGAFCPRYAYRLTAGGVSSVRPGRFVVVVCAWRGI